VRAALSLILAAVLLSAGPLAEICFAAAPSCCGPESPCAPAASAPVPVAIARPAVPRLPMPFVAKSAAFLFDARERAKGGRAALADSATLRVGPPVASLRL
jgi:hypothetical protein